MELINDRTRLSSRGQVVIPKTIRQLANLVAGDELEIVYDGERILLMPVEVQDHSGEYEDSRQAAERVREQVAKYSPGQAKAKDRPSRLWGERIRAVARIEELRKEFAGVNWDEIRQEARGELERRGSDE